MLPEIFYIIFQDKLAIGNKLESYGPLSIKTSQKESSILAFTSLDLVLEVFPKLNKNQYIVSSSEINENWEHFESMKDRNTILIFDEETYKEYKKLEQVTESYFEKLLIPNIFK